MAVKKSRYPWVTFRINGGNYCISSRFVSSMMLEYNFQPLPDSAECVLGVFEKLGEIIPVINMRCLLGMPPAFTLVDSLRDMKRQHIEWVDTLAECLKTGEPFPLARDAHECSFGHWFYHFETENAALNRILRQVQLPHEQMHALADVMEEKRNAGQMDEAQRQVDLAKELCYSRCLPLVDELLSVGNEINQGILIVLELGQKKLAIQVDEISGVMHFENVSDESQSTGGDDSPYVSSIITNSGVTFLKLSADALANIRC